MNYLGIYLKTSHKHIYESLERFGLLPRMRDRSLKRVQLPSRENPYIQTSGETNSPESAFAEQPAAAAFNFARNAEASRRAAAREFKSL